MLCKRAHRHLSLEQQAAFLRAFVERTTPSAVVDTDLSGNVLSFCNTAEATYGYSAREILGQSATRLWDPGETANAERIFAAAQSGGKWEGPCRHAQRSGRVFTAQVTVLLHRTSAGRPRGLVAICRDMTVIQRIDEELRTSQELGRSLVDTSNELLLLLDPSGAVLESNRLAREITTRPPPPDVGAATAEEPLDTHLRELLFDSARAEELVAQVLTQDELQDVELSLRSGDAGRLPVRCDAMAVRGPSREQDVVLLAMRPTISRLHVVEGRKPGVTACHRDSERDRPWRLEPPSANRERVRVVRQR